MPIPGPQAHQQLIAAYNHAAANLERLRGQVGEISQRRDQLEVDRDDTLRKLAAFYLPDLTAESVQQAWAEIRPALSEILLRKDARVHDLREQLNEENGQRMKLEAGLQDLSEQLDAAENRQHAIAAEVESHLAGQPDFAELAKHAGMAEVALQRAQDNLDEISQDAARKLPAYNEDRLFCYLKDRRFGTSEYHHRGFTRRMDRFVANLIDYPKAKRDYDFLTNTPAAMRKIIAEDGAALDTVMAEIQDHRDRAAAKFGLPDQVAAAGSLAAQRESTITRLDAQTAACESTQTQLNGIESPKGEFYRDAIELFRTLLAEKSSGKLREEARHTPEVTDDQIVASLGGIENQMEHSEQTNRHHQDELQQRQEIYQSIGRLIQRFRASGFDRPRCRFSDSLDLPGSLERINSPADVDALWDSIRRAQGA